MKIYVTGNLEAARKTYELWAQTYPRDDIPHVNLSSIYANLGDYDKALAATLGLTKAQSRKRAALCESRCRVF